MSGPVPNNSRTGSSPRPGGWGPPKGQVQLGVFCIAVVWQTVIGPSEVQAASDAKARENG